MAAKKQKPSTLDDLLLNKDAFDKESQGIISSFEFAKAEIETINAMKRTPGWRLLEKKIREELHSRIRDAVKADPKVQTLLALLEVTATKSRSKRLDEEIESLMQD